MNIKELVECVGVYCISILLVVGAIVCALRGNADATTALIAAFVLSLCFL
jgi:hypothetical protein